MATLETPPKLRELQRALYQRAKKDSRFRFYALYDKVYRPDVLGHAYAVAKANAGAAGPDGMTFAEIEENGSAGLLEKSNEAFDASLRAQDPAWGVRDVDEVEAVASAAGLQLGELIDMPSNNLCVVLRRL